MIVPKLNNLWSNLIVENPMLIEIVRFRRKFFSFRGSAANGAVLGLAALCYVGLIASIFTGRGEIPPLALVIFQTCVLIMIAPTLMYGAIAGERERRSWDLLLAAPITKTQIVVGKYMGAMAAIGLAALLMGVPILLSGLTYQRTNWHDLFLGELVSVSFALLVCALTLLISARVRRAFMALGTTLGVLTLGLIVGPLLLSYVLSSVGNGAMEMALYLHPVMTLVSIENISQSTRFDGSGSTIYMPYGIWGYPQVALYLGMAVVLVRWAAVTLHFAENDVKFINRSRENA